MSDPAAYLRDLWARDELIAQRTESGFRKPWERGVDPAVIAHVHRHGPARVLADIAAKRKILDLCVDALHENESGPDPVAAGVIEELATAEGWTPDTEPPAWPGGARRADHRASLGRA